MRRLSLALVAACVLSASSGCSMCCAPFDTAFGAYGGAVERDDLYHGRVGSTFDPAAGQVVSSYEYDEQAMVGESMPQESMVDDSTVIEPQSAFESGQPTP